MSHIGPNSGRPICKGWDQTQKTIGLAFGNSLDKFATVFRDFQGIKLDKVALLGQNMKPPAGFVNAEKKPPSVFSRKGGM